MVIGGLAEHHDQGNPAEDRDEQQELSPARVAHVRQPTGTDRERRDERPEDKDGAHERDDHRDEANDQPGEIEGPELAPGGGARKVGVMVDYDVPAMVSDGLDRTGLRCGGIVWVGGHFLPPRYLLYLSRSPPRSKERDSQRSVVELDEHVRPGDHHGVADRGGDQ